ncbi:NAD-glutamate dehydrogenase [Pseudoclavibacter terrae]|uniref:NAD-glutamate dehydrogenase n=1 Tax=Pseudoclavibacter terrae TaxID=1530195 RepID=A0A7J5AZR8_9MICO|nr:NAD-glutamate dehydrogenase [Pseudoclavibacter terrae]KAB1636110.1 NAD-glutamate dehydrogenase [Pseudoclavibacter terrae]
MTKEAAHHPLHETLADVDPALREGLEHLIGPIAAEGLGARQPRDIVGAAASARRQANQRSTGETLLSIFTPTLQDDGWTSRRTVINICTPDAPFLVDSITAAIGRQGFTVQSLVHPVLSVRRDAEGVVLEMNAPDGVPESWMHLEIDRIPTPEGRAALEEHLRKVLADVHAAVTDWTPMHRTCLDLVGELRAGRLANVDGGEVAATLEFLTWLAQGNFTFLGYREYALDSSAGEGEVLRALPATGLGILRDSPASVTLLTPEAQRTAREPRLLTITKANSRATVHRDVYLDYIGIRTFDDQGNVTGERRFLGLFTSITYAASVTTLPIIAAKVRAILDASGFPADSHSGKDLLQVLEQYPRDELFQSPAELLLEVARQVTKLPKRGRPKIFVRPDEFGRFVSAIIYLPRDRYNTSVRLRIEELLRTTFGASQVDHATKVGDSPLAQLHFIVRAQDGSTLASITEPRLQSQLERAIKSWDEGLVDALHQSYDEERAAVLLSRYASAFPAGYKEAVPPQDAVSDIELLENLDDTSDFAVHLYEPHKHEGGKRYFTLVSRTEYPLTQVLPVLTDLGVGVVDERPYAVILHDGSVLHVSDFGLTASRHAAWGDAAWGAEFEAAFSAVWSGESETDRLNSLVLLGGLRWRQIVILRAISMYLRQIGATFSVEYIEQALIENPAIAADIVRLFEAKFDPELVGDRDAELVTLTERLLAALDDVASLDHDRILRSMIGIVDATWRTNFYQVDEAGKPKHWVSMKLDCTRVPGLPKPHPMAEIWVYSPEVEGVHLRFGRVARGGLRWSDRREDFRTEVLGLVKAQMVKNAVIVPTGSKGGFFAKQLPAPSDRGAWLEAGKSAYRTFIRGLLDITDNREGGEIVPPANVVRHDGDDPYLVVAADKGTASFSDIANGISESYDFWLADAFASGGSAGYDHKGMGITARGAWESVKRHFRELGHDTQTQDFTVVGVGDMSGDVFGNGMLRSEHIRLVAAFDHRHIFIDPNPHAAATFVERQRLFDLPGSSWDDFDRSVISEGGGVFPLTQKSIPVTPQMREALGLEGDVQRVTPLELKKAMLLAPVDLLWNGAIGTYIKASDETNAEIGDRGNDAIRVDGRELRLKVVGEGGNLGVSQRGRIEAALSGVSLNTDAIDNSAGVGTSDREVNIKILLGAVERDGRLDREARNEVLRAMTDEVAAKVLRDNYEQNVLLGNSRANAAEMLPSHKRLIAWLEERDELDRDLEFLPSNAEIKRRIEEGRGLTRPEFSVLVAYAKLALKSDLASTDLADDPWFANTLAEYFPAEVREQYADDLHAHPLRQEIVVNDVVNSMVNRGGITFAYRAADETGATSEEIARAYVAAREIFDLRGFVVEIEATDNAVSTATQTELYLGFRRLLDRATRWFVQHRPDRIDVGEEITRFRAPVAQFASRMGELQQGVERERFDARVAEFEEAGVPRSLALRGAGLLELMPLLDIIERAGSEGWDLEEFAGVYYSLSARVSFDDMLTRVTALPQDDRWGSMARAAMRDDLYAVMVELAASVISQTEPAEPDTRVDAWIAELGPTATRALGEASDAVHAGDDTGLATLSVALRRLRSLVR